MHRWDLHRRTRERFGHLHVQRCNLAVQRQRKELHINILCDTHGSEQCLVGVLEELYDGAISQEAAIIRIVGLGAPLGSILGSTLHHIVLAGMAIVLVLLFNAI